MTRRVSFTSLERALTPEFRERINHAEGVIDLENFYSQTGLKLLSMVLDDGIRLMPDDIQFDPDAPDGFRISRRLATHPRYRELARTSDLEQILARFAATVQRRYAHYRKHPERPIAKMRA